MSHFNNRRFRPTLESLEGRELPTANLLGSLPVAPLAHTLVRDHAPVVQIDQAASPATTQHSQARAGVVFDGTYQDSLISLRNNTNYNVAFEFRWSNGS